MTCGCVLKISNDSDLFACSENLEQTSLVGVTKILSTIVTKEGLKRVSSFCRNVEQIREYSDQIVITFTERSYLLISFQSPKHLQSESKVGVMCPHNQDI